jgi:hypothetical protein
MQFIKFNRETGFYGIRAATVAMKWFGKHVSTIDAVFSVGPLQRNYLTNKRRYSSVLSSEFSVEDSQAKFVEDKKTS